jgi:cysteine desulfurase family protein
VIYLDHPATSWPKPPEVACAMTDFLEQAGGNPGRSGHRLSIAAGRIVYETRDALASIFGAPKPDHVIFAHNATHALNTVIQGVLRPGDTALTTSMEHNSVMRPLRFAESRGVRVRIAPCSATGEVDTRAFEELVKRGVRLVILTHASNVIGRIVPVADLAGIAREAGAMVLVDAAQTAGVLPISVCEMGIDFLAFTGHKALQGPPGTGGLILCSDRAADEIKPLMRGGTGSSSQSQEQPDALPDRLESGTPNGVGIAGLGAAVRRINDYGIDRIREHHAALITRLIDGLDAIPGVEIFGPPSDVERAPLVSFRVAGKAVSEVGLRLDEDYGILCRVGLHCAPAAHQTIGTFPEGTVRFGVGPFTTEEDIDRAIAAVREVAADG